MEIWGIGGSLELLKEIGCKQCDRLYQAGRVKNGGNGGEKVVKGGKGGWLCSMMLKNFSKIKKGKIFLKMQWLLHWYIGDL